MYCSCLPYLRITVYEYEYQFFIDGVGQLQFFETPKSSIHFFFLDL